MLCQITLIQIFSCTRKLHYMSILWFSTKFGNVYDLVKSTLAIISMEFTDLEIFTIWSINRMLLLFNLEMFVWILIAIFLRKLPFKGWKSSFLKLLTFEWRTRGLRNLSLAVPFCRRNPPGFLLSHFFFLFHFSHTSTFRCIMGVIYVLLRF